MVENGETGSNLSAGDVTSAQIDIINEESFEEYIVRNLVEENSEEALQQLSSSSLSVQGLGYKILWMSEEDGNIVNQDSETQGHTIHHHNLLLFNLYMLMLPPPLSY